MESLTPPPLCAVRELRGHLLAGRSMREAVERYLDAHADCFAQDLRERRLRADRSPPPPKSPLRAALLTVIERGCLGDPSTEALATIEEELERAAEHEIELHLAALPFKILIPMLLFNFPGYMLLLLGPLLRTLTGSIGG